MFTGIVSEMGIIISKKPIKEGFRFKVKAKKAALGLKVSDSIAVNGVCHTVMHKRKNEFEFISMNETLKKTNLGLLKVSDTVNLERTLRLGGELGGHFVLGHVDDTGEITKVKQIASESRSKKGSENWEFNIRLNKKYREYVIPVGSITVDGVSLTVADIFPVKGKFFEIKVAIIPYTYRNTNFGFYKSGSKVNIEFDFLGKYMLNVIKIRNRKS